MPGPDLDIRRSRVCSQGKQRSENSHAFHKAKQKTKMILVSSPSSSRLFLLFLISCCQNYASAQGGIPSLGKCGRVHLTVSSMDEAYLELNWVTNCDRYEDAPDIIALFHQDPRSISDRVLSPLASINAHFYSEGFYVTKVKFNPPWLPGEWDYYENLTRTIPGPHCFPYWIVSIKENRIIHTNCLRIQPTWMNDNRGALGSQRIGTIFIPGTHNSGAYAGVPRFLEKYILNQDRDIWTQLVFGIRYLDFRVGYYQNEGFYINHDFVRIMKLTPLLREIRHFLELSPKEVVVLDFHRFPYPTVFENSTHRKLVELIYRELGHLVLEPAGLQTGKGPTLNEIWQHNKTLIICYGQRHIAKEYTWLWNPLQQYWGDKRRVSELKDYLQASIKAHNTVSNPMWALMAELTIGPVDVIFGSNTNRKLADATNRQLTKWFRDEWAKEANIVASDFFLGNDLINVAIEANKIR